MKPKSQPFEYQLEVVKALSKRLQAENIKHALGGSALLYALGIDVDVNDWDITTNAHINKLTDILKDYSYTEAPISQDFASDYLLNIWIDDVEIDLIGNFAIRTEKGITKVDTVVSSYWHDIPLSSAKEWHKAYVAMNRIRKAKLLEEYLS